MGTEDLYAGKAGGSFFGPMLPGSFYPSNPAECGWWYNWAVYMRNGGRGGWAAPERIKELERMWQRLVTSPTRDAKMAAWKAVTDRFASDLPLIGILTSPGKVVYVRNGFKNVPRLALAGWIAHEPGNTCPECYFFEKR
jgi:ABC-type transport system substrate-binding protein